MESWLDATYRIVDEEVAPVLEAAGFRKKRYHWERPRPGGGTNSLELAWSRYARRGDDHCHVRCIGDQRAKHFVMGSGYALGTDAAQVNNFVNTGHHVFAEAVLGPLALLGRYHEMLADVQALGLAAPYSVTAPVPTREDELEALARRVRSPHRYRWSVPDELRRTLREDLAALQLVWELTARIASVFDERGLFRAF